MAFDDPDDDSQRGQDSVAAARRKVGWVGIALIVVAVGGGLSNAGLAVVAAVIRSAGPKPQPPANMARDEKEAWERGRDAAPAMEMCGMVFVSLVYLPVLLGGLRLQQGRGRGFGMTAAAFATLPCSPAFLLGLPVGVWALVVLNQPDVREALEPPPRRRRAGRDEDDEWDDRPRRRRGED